MNNQSNNVEIHYGESDCKKLIEEILKTVFVKDLKG